MDQYGTPSCYRPFHARQAWRVTEWYPLGEEHKERDIELALSTSNGLSSGGGCISVFDTNTMWIFDNVGVGFIKASCYFITPDPLNTQVFHSVAVQL